MQQPSIEADTEFHVGQTVELQAAICRSPCEPDCGCMSLAARNGHRGAVLSVQPSMIDGEHYYEVDGLDGVVLSGIELRAVQS